MSNQDDIVSQMRAGLSQSEPDLDTSTGTTSRKILDVVGEQIADVTVDTHIQSYQYDVDSKSGSDLDTFCLLIGGIARIGAIRATGSLTFTRASTANTYVPIPIHTIVGTLDPSGITVTTVAAGVIPPGGTTITLPCQAIIGGTNGNIGSGLMTQLLTNIQGVSVTNSAALTGGSDQETDDALRIRWKKTAFRSMVGTQDMYLGVALDDPDAYAANVLGASKTHTEQIEVISGAATSQLTGSTFNYETSVVVGPDISAGNVFLLNYDFQTVPGSNPLQVQKISGSTSRMVDGFYDMSYSYTPSSSRNIPNKHINNRVDVWVAGNRPQTAVQSLRWDPSRVFTATTTSDYYNQIFVRPDGTHPTNGNILLPLFFGPISSVPATISVSGRTFNYQTDYWIVHRDDAFGWTASSVFGLEWKASSALTGNPVFTIGSNNNYTYNNVPTAIQQHLSNVRLIGMDAQVHQAKNMYLRFNLVIMYSVNATTSSVKNAITVAIGNAMRSINFGSVLQASDVLALVAGIPGVDNVRFRDGQDVVGYNSSLLSSSTPPSIAIQQVVPFQPTVHLGPPVLSTPTTSGTGGSLVTGNYFYEVTALNIDGETNASNETTIHVGGVSTGQTTLTWTAVAGATSYNIYRSATTGNEVYLDTVYGSSTVTYNDLGLATPGTVTPPLASTASAPGNVQVVQTFCVPSTGRPIDIELADNQVCVLDSTNGVYLDRRAQNTFYNTATGGL